MRLEETWRAALLLTLEVRLAAHDRAGVMGDVIADIARAHGRRRWRRTLRAPARRWSGEVTGLAQVQTWLDAEWGQRQQEVASYRRPHNRQSWLRGRDLNPRPLGYEPNELPDCSTPRQSVTRWPYRAVAALRKTLTVARDCTLAKPVLTPTRRITAQGR